jgi:hypothetical protein
MGKRRLSLADRVDRGTLIEDTIKSVSKSLKDQDVEFHRSDYVMGAQFMLVVIREITEDDEMLASSPSRFGRRLESIQSELLEMRCNWQRRESL